MIGIFWNVRGVATYNRLSELKRSIERVYPGISRKWRRTGFSKQRTEAYRRKTWKGLDCSFCCRLPDEFEQMVERGGLRICDICIREFVDTLHLGKNSVQAG